MPPRAVIGRDAELAALEAFLDGVDRGPCALVLSGEAGIGKTILWEAGVEAAGARFRRVLSCRGAEAEASLSFTGLSDLLGDVFEEVAPELAPLRRRALEVALLLVEPGDLPPDPRAIGLALLDALRRLAERGPVVVALDDVQWLDSSTAAVLQIALRRLRDERLGVLATLRKAPGLAAPLEFGLAFDEGRLTQLALQPLSLAALHHLLKERLALELTRGELTRLQETSGGNPFFALELARELEQSQPKPAVGQSLRVPESLRELLGHRLARLPTETGDVLLHVAALARPTFELVAEAHGDRDGVLGALEVAVAEGVIELGDPRLRFVNPLLASICYEQAAPWKRRAVHRALAGVVTDLEERARHLALAAEGPEAATASELEVAAGQAAARGAPTSAAELSELSAALTPDDPTLVRRRRFQAAGFYGLAGELDRAATLYQLLLAEVPSGVERADILFSLAMLMATVHSAAATREELFDEALAEAGDDDTRAARILANKTGIQMFHLGGKAALADGRLALEKAERVGDPGLLAAVIARLSHVEEYAVEITPGLLERGVEIERHLQSPAAFYYESPAYALARLQIRRGELDPARALLADVEAGAAARGDEGSRVMVLWTLAMLEWLAGRWPRAHELSDAAYELTEQTQHEHALIWTARVKALVEADLGLVDQARASAEEGIAFAQTVSGAHTIFGLGSLGHLELVLGNIGAAGEYLRDLPGRLLAGGMNDPSQPVWADAIETLIALGELDRARSYLEPYEAHARGLGSPLAMEGVRRCRGLAAAAEGNVTAAVGELETAVAEQPSPPWVFERGRTLLCLGSAYRQAKQKRAARETLERALTTFEELGARPWAEKARAELRRISGRRPATAELTETEERVAALAAAGRSNKEIAAELYMSVHTVGAHLSRVYRKLGIHSRSELAARLVKTTAEEAPPA